MVAKRRNVDIRFGFVPLPEGEARTRKLWVRVSPREVKALEAKACEAKTPFSDWVRNRLLSP